MLGRAGKAGTKRSGAPLEGMLILRPGDLRGNKRIDRHRAAQLAMLRGRLMRRIANRKAAEVEQVAVFVHAAHQPVFKMKGPQSKRKRTDG
ncbi:hypothetical protein [Mesorhizobium sp. M4B.F.Ca.ET.058.02.1.1]|uniref:hypothetical protein n=1 Tax=Mesorhizobium sp. M4B.F.Ca.ET.058.02.1.1 TaxID=2493675 RepID=UPI0011F9939B|nr:hypothetical protein [Mesorhizobium sp. M4B.F.Ca.ET.058.02.1.1]TIU69091.1 MAG: hypothetical protein E5W25_10955 [Mesorhizobium sp.]